MCLEPRAHLVLVWLGELIEVAAHFLQAPDAIARCADVPVGRALDVDVEAAAARLPGLVEAPVVLGPKQERLGHRLLLDGGRQVHGRLVVEEPLRHGERQPGTLREAQRERAKEARDVGADLVQLRRLEALEQHIDARLETLAVQNPNSLYLNNVAGSIEFRGKTLPHGREASLELALASMAVVAVAALDVGAHRAAATPVVLARGVGLADEQRRGQASVHGQEIGVDLDGLSEVSRSLTVVVLHPGFEAELELGLSRLRRLIEG